MKQETYESATAEIDAFITNEGKGNVRDALNVALARLARVEAERDEWRSTAGRWCRHRDELAEECEVAREKATTMRALILGGQTRAPSQEWQVLFDLVAELRNNVMQADRMAVRHGDEAEKLRAKVEHLQGLLGRARNLIRDRDCKPLLVEIDAALDAKEAQQ